MTTTSQNPNPEVSALKEQLKQTQLAYQMASEMSQFKAGFLARVSHELRSPLSKLISLHQLILSDLCEDSAEEREFIAQAYAAAQNFKGMLDQILNVARTEYGSNRLDIQPLQLAEVLAQVYDLTRLPAADRNHRLTIKPPAPEIYILADPRWLRQVLINLVDAPLKLREPIVSVSISAHSEPASGYARIWIEDDRPTHVLSEPIDLLQSESQTTEQGDEALSLSPGLTLLVNQTLLELMKGRLEILAIPSPNEASNLTRIQCSIPLVNPQSLLIEIDENLS
jgi:signal transduction histidine kinase